MYLRTGFNGITMFSTDQNAFAWFGDYWSLCGLIIEIEINAVGNTQYL